jgi:hypothetical protein
MVVFTIYNQSLNLLLEKKSKFKRFDLERI